MSDLTDELNLDGAPESAIERFKNSDSVFDGNSDELVKEYKEDVLDADEDSEEEFREALRRHIEILEAGANEISVVRDNEDDEDEHKSKPTAD